MWSPPHGLEYLRTETDRSPWRPLPARRPSCCKVETDTEASLTDEQNQEIQPDQPHELPQSRHRSSWVATAVVVFAVLVCASAYLWLNYGDQVRSTVLAEAPTAPPVVASGQEAVSRSDFETFKRKTADSLQSAIADLDTQKADLKRLSGQVAALVSKVEASQSEPATAPAQAPVLTTIPALHAAPPRPAVASQRNRPSAPPKASGPISIGGAPLPLVPHQQDQ